MIVVSGIPGSGKSKFAESLAKTFASEGLATATFKAPVADQLKFSTARFIQQIIQFKE